MVHLTRSCLTPITSSPPPEISQATSAQSTFVHHLTHIEIHSCQLLLRELSPSMSRSRCTRIQNILHHLLSLKNMMNNPNPFPINLLPRSLLSIPPHGTIPS